jgi:hypothetical protein
MTYINQTGKVDKRGAEREKNEKEGKELNDQFRMYTI